MGHSGDKASVLSVLYRCADDSSEVARDWTAAGIDELASATPWRTFRWYRGQRHYSGTYWSSSVGSHVIYESRLELARLLFADFDVSVRQIVAQPFLLRASVERKPRKHIPDYLLITDTGPVVVDVKPARRLSDPKVDLTFAWTRELVEARGWRYEVATEPDAVELENIRFLAGYRRDWLFRRELLAQVREKNLDGSLLADALKCLPGEPIQQVKSAVLHLLWRQELLIDLSEPLGGRTELRRPA